MRIGVFGGSFDPPHLGHVLGCLWALETGEIDHVLLIPTSRHPFGKSPVASFEQRVAMCRVAVARLGEAVEVSRLEEHREGPSYTVDTLRALKGERPSARFRLIVGSDVVAELHKWHQSEEVLRLAPPLALPRPAPGTTVEHNPGALPPVSSSAVRELLRSGGDVTTLLGKSVRDYIAERNLYREQAP